MKPVFEVIPEAIFFLQTTLICELSADSFSCIFTNEADKKMHGLFVFHLDKEKELSGQLKKIFDEQPLLGKQYKKVFISFTGEESALLPEELYKPGENQVLINTLYGDLTEGAIATDLVAGKKIYNVYRMPSSVRHVLVERFPLAVFSHQYSLLIKEVWEGDQLRVIFYRDVMVVVLVKGGELQLIHSFGYQSTTDVVYHLMNICKQFAMIDVPLQAGGMIEPGAELHKELNYYFKTIGFDKLPGGYEYTEVLKALPPHYFSYLFSLASCV